MPLNWSNIWPGGEPFYTPAEEDTYIPTSGYENLDVTGRAQTNQQKKNEWMKNFYEENKDQLGTINPDLNQVNKGSMFPPWMGALMGTTAGGIYGAAKMAGSQGNEMMNAYNAANAAGLNLEDYIERDGTRVSINPEFYADEYAATPVDASGLFGQEQISPRPSGVFPETENLTSPFMEEPSGVGEGYDKQGLWDRLKGAPLGIINALTGRQGATESFGGYPGGAESRAGLFPNEVKNLQRLADKGYLAGQGQDVFGTNVVSQFGDYDEAMAKNLGVFEETMGKKGYTDLNELEEYYREAYGPKSYILNKLRHVRGWPGQGPKVPPVNVRDIPDTGGVTTGAPITGGDAGRPGSPSYATKAGAQATWDRPGAKGSPGYHWSQGGRVGYNKGGRVGILAAF